MARNALAYSTLAKQELSDSEARLLRLIANAERSLRIAATNAIIAARDAPGTLAELTALIEQGRIEEAIDAAARAGVLRLSAGYAAVYTVTGQQTAQFIENALDVVVDFDVVNERAVQHMRDARLRYVREFSEAQRAAARSAMTVGIEGGRNPIEQARRFRESIGLTARQVDAVDNFRRLLEDSSGEALNRELRDRRFDRTVRRATRGGDPLSQVQIDRMVTRYRERYLRFRSETIARTEALGVVHAANDEAFRQAVDDQLIDGTQIERKWRTASDERVRPTHAAANGQVRGLNEPFLVGGSQLRYPGDSRGPAKEIIRCRCTVTTRLVA